MESMSIATRDGGSVELSGEALQQFAGGLGGALVTRSSPDYEEVRAVWNAMIETRPALIARCANAADVQSCVRFAGANNL